MRIALAGIIGFCLCVCIEPPRAQAAFCDQVRRVAAPGHFEQIKGEWDPELEAYRSTTAIDGSTCTISESLTSWRCRWRQSSRSAAEQHFRQLSHAVQECFAGDYHIDESGRNQDRGPLLGGPFSYFRVILGQKVVRILVAVGGARTRSGDRWITSMSLNF